jgi:cytoskeleton protein RodZ
MQNQKALRVGVKVEDAPSWLRVIADGQSVLSQESRPRFSQTFEADKEIVVQAWNAGAVSVEANGKDVGRLGKSGEHWDWTFAL